MLIHCDGITAIQKQFVTSLSSKKQRRKGDREIKIIQAKAGWMFESRFSERTAAQLDIVDEVCCCVFPYESSAPANGVRARRHRGSGKFH